MEMAFRIIVLTLTAICLWLGVRVYNRRERWAKWTLAAVVCLPVLYIGSFGPACWWFSPGIGVTGDCVVAPAIYLPIGRVYLEADHDGVISHAIAWYGTLRHESVQVRYNADVNAMVQFYRFN
jgi:hypothetical protein